MAAYVFGWLEAAYARLIVVPLRRLYFEGPDPPFWAGRPHNRICARLTDTSEELWAVNPGECAVLVEQRFQAFNVGVGTVLYFVCLVWAAGAAGRLLCRRRTVVVVEPRFPLEIIAAQSQ